MNDFPALERPPVAEPVLTGPAIVFDWRDAGTGALSGAGLALVAAGGALYLLRKSDR